MKGQVITKVIGPERFETALRRFDEENAKDPNMEKCSDVDHPRELLYAQRLTEWVTRLSPRASEALRLAARCQHICRWMIPRSSHEMTRSGYLRWRNDLKQFHAEKSGEILREAGYPEDVIREVQSLNLKKTFPKDPEARVLEDALCLVFLQYQFAELLDRTDEAKMIGILQKTWKKMTPEAQAHALRLPFSSKEKALVDRALG